MRKTLQGLAIATAVLLAGTALAVGPGGKLFVKAKNTKVYDKPNASAKVVNTLQPGEEVTWVGSAKANPQFHEVKSSKGAGFAHQSTLSPRKPTGEVLTSDGAPVSAQAFASSGAATKALTEAGVKYAKEKGPDAQVAAAEVIYVEEWSKASATPETVAKHQKALAAGGGK